jgi:dTDP-4-amino-4,6-dideoxygalactose transaminase
MTSTLPQIPLFDLRLDPEDLEAVAETLRSGWLSMGPRTAEFEQEFAARLGCRHVLAVSSCTAALHLAYLAAGVGPGDEVIVPSYTFVATSAAARYCGARPVFADILGQHDLSIDPDDVAAKLSERTKAVVAVHFAGNPAPVDRLERLCAEAGVALIEDAAHAPSASLGGRKLGTFGLASAFSLFSNKVLSVGEGGMVATDDDEVAERVRLLRSHSMTSGTWDRHNKRTDTYDVAGLGFNYRLDEPRAALALARLPHLERDIERRRALIRRYRHALRDVPGIEIPYTDEAVATSTCYVMAVLVPAESRDAVREALLTEHAIQTSLFYPPTHLFSAYRDPPTQLPETELASSREITIPLYPHMTEDEQDRVVEALRQEVPR